MLNDFLERLFRQVKELASELESVGACIDGFDGRVQFYWQSFGDYRFDSIYAYISNDV